MMSFIKKLIQPPRERKKRTLPFWKDWRSFVQEIEDSWNIPTIFLLVVLIAGIWLFRNYCLEKPLDDSPFLEWGLEIWIPLDALLFFILLRAGGWLRYPALLLVTFWATVHATSAKVYNALLHYGQIASAMDTNSSETAGFLEFLGWFPWAAMVCFFIVFWLLTWKTSRTGWIGWGLFACLSFAPLAEVVVPAILGVQYSQSYEFMKFPAEKMKQRYINSLAYRYPTMVGQYVSIQRRMAEASHKERTLPEGIFLPAQGTDRHLPRRIVIMLGETDWRGHHGAYGYEHGTDFFMMRMRKDPVHAAFYDGIASAAVTRDSVVRIMTFASSRNEEPFYENMGVLDMAKNAGYETAWFSRQTSTGIHDTLVRIVAQQAQQTTYFDSGRDDVLVPPLVEKFNQNKQVLVHHGWGGHMWYADRHDDDDYRLAEKSEENYRHYDAAIGHIDKVQEQLTKHGDSETLFIYIPDHGEIVNLGHGTADMAGSQYDVPFYAWSSNSAYITAFRKAVEKHLVQIHGSKRFNTASFAFVMAELMGYQVADRYFAQSREDAEYTLCVDGNPNPVTNIRWDLPNMYPPS